MNLSNSKNKILNKVVVNINKFNLIAAAVVVDAFSKHDK